MLAHSLQHSQCKLSVYPVFLRQWIFFAVYALTCPASPRLSPVYFPLMASVWLSGWGPERPGGWQRRVWANTLRLLHRGRRHLNIFISSICPPHPHVSSDSAGFPCARTQACDFGLFVTWDYSGFIYLASLSDATEDSTELLYFLPSLLFGVVRRRLAKASRLAPPPS